MTPALFAWFGVLRATSRGPSAVCTLCMVCSTARATAAEHRREQTGGHNGRTPSASDALGLTPTADAGSADGVSYIEQMFL